MINKPADKKPFIALIFFFLSGMCGFIYEIVWTHLFSLVIGDTIYTQIIAITVFISGIAIGGVVSSRFADRLMRPMKVYALLSLVISFFAFLSPGVIFSIEPLLKFLYQNHQSSIYLVNLLMSLLCGLALLFPAGLLGATLPVLMSYSMSSGRSGQGVGFAAGRFYAVGGFGVAIGILLSGFILLPYLGYRLTLDITVGLNILLSIGAYMLSLKEEPKVLKEDAGHNAKKPVEKGGHKKAMVFCIFFLIGFGGMMYQIAMTRALILIFDATIYSVATILASFILAIALGCLASAYLKDVIRDRFLLLSISQVIFVIAVLTVTAIIEQLPLSVENMTALHQNSFAAYRILQFALIFGLFLVPASILGFVFGMGSRIYMRDISKAAHDIGIIYIINVAGVIAGLLIGVFILLPFIGIRDTILMSAVLSMIIGIVLVFYSNLSKLLRFAVSSLVVIILPAAFLLIPAWDTDLMTDSAAVYASDSIKKEMDSEEIKKEIKKRNTTIYYKEGAMSTVSVTKSDDGILSLKVDGSVVASADINLTAKELLAHAALMLHKNPKDILLIGLGSGASLEAITSHAVEKIDCVEVSKEVAEATQFFRDVNKEATLDWRLRLLPVDGRTHLALSGLKYDIIIATPSEPWMYGMSGFFTKEYFNAARKSLREDGLMVQWINGNRLSEENFRVVVRTFLEAFPYASLWDVNRAAGDYLLLGSAKRVSFDYQRMKERLHIEMVMHGLERVGITDLSTIFNRFIMDDGSMREYSWDATVATDDNDYLEFSSARDLLKTLHPIRHKINDYRFPPFSLLANITKDEAENVNKAYMADSHIRNAEDLFETEGRMDEARKELKKATSLVPGNRDIAQSAARAYLTIGKMRSGDSNDEAIGLYKNAIELYPEYGEAWYYLGSEYYNKGMYDEAMNALKEAVRLYPMSPRSHKALAFAYKKKGDNDLAKREYETAERLMKTVEFIQQ